jgi:hypothetical protein
MFCSFPVENNPYLSGRDHARLKTKTSKIKITIIAAEFYDFSELKQPAYRYLIAQKTRW